jgi:hypothetical protein
MQIQEHTGTVTQRENNVKSLENRYRWRILFGMTVLLTKLRGKQI